MLWLDTLNRKSDSVSVISLIIGCLFISAGCESSPPQVNSAIPITWGESNTLQLVSQNASSTQPWRKIEVLTRGVLTIGLESTHHSGQVELTVKNESGRRNIFKKAFDLKPHSPLTVSLNVDGGQYYMVVEPRDGQILNAGLSARFQPEDPDALSGADKEREGAQQLQLTQSKEGAVSYRDGNATDWFRYDAPSAETLLLNFSPQEQSKGIKAECITPTGLSFPLTGQDKIVLREAGTVWIRIYAEHAESGGGYKITAQSSPFNAISRRGMILKYNGNTATINMGIEDGIREGLRGFLQRSDGSIVDFVIENSLQRTSRARAVSLFKISDINQTVNFESK
ncbi:MAG: hypothetical protein RJB13_950 [Pseudomonadota bacterium]